MSNAKQLIIKNQDEFEILENLYKLLKLEKSRQSVQEEGRYSTDEVRQYFQEKYCNSSPGSHAPFSNNEESGVLIWKIDSEKKLAGDFVILTNPYKDPQQLLEIYRNKDVVEKMLW